MKFARQIARFSPLALIVIASTLDIGCAEPAVPKSAVAAQDATVVPTEVAPSIILPNDQWRIVRYIHVDGEPGIVIHRTGMNGSVDGVVRLRDALSIEDATHDTRVEMRGVAAIVGDPLLIDNVGSTMDVVFDNGMSLQDGEVALYMATKAPNYAVVALVSWEFSTLTPDQQDQVRRELRVLAVTSDAVEIPVWRDRAVPYNPTVKPASVTVIKEDAVLDALFSDPE